MTQSKEQKKRAAELASIFLSLNHLGQECALNLLQSLHQMQNAPLCEKEIEKRNLP